MKSQVFDVQHLLHELKHYLPTQTPLKDFIHHNTLHAFQNRQFYDAIFKANTIFGFEVTFPVDDYRTLYKNGRIREDILDTIIQKRKGTGAAGQQGNKAGIIPFWKDIVLNKTYTNVFAPRVGRLRANWKAVYHIDLDTLVQPLLFRILSSYLDQGIALWHFPNETKGLIYALKALEKDSLVSFFKSKRAKQLLFDEGLSIEKLLNIVVGKPEYYEQYIFDQQCSHRGWSGMVASIEDHPDGVLYPKKIALHDLIVLDLLLEIDALDAQFGHNWQPLVVAMADYKSAGSHVGITNSNKHQMRSDDIALSGVVAKLQPIDLFAEIQPTEQQEVLKIWQDAFEWTYYDEVLAALASPTRHTVRTPEGGMPLSPKPVLNREGNSMIPPLGVRGHFQALFCIDEREDSLRRHLEASDPHCETLGAPGFFGVEFYFQPQFGKFYEKLCPAPVTPKYLIKETHVTEHRKHALLYTKKAHSTLQGFFISLSLGGVAALRLVQHLFSPKMSPAISDAFAHMNINGQLQIDNKGLDDQENGLQLGFTVPEMATRVENLLRGIGIIQDFSPIFYVVAHGSSSANNPHHGAHDCGACSGRPGSVNARVFSYMANKPEVRAILAKNGLIIPAETQFLGALHDTAADEIVFYDEHTLSPENTKRHAKNKVTFENALDLNAKERSRRFSSINTKQDIKKVREAIRRRSVSLFEPRPELGHGTNALCFIGNRKLTKNLFLDRRAFMNSYDYRTDLDGSRLLGVMRPIPVVCGGINLEYYFSRMDNYKLGAGTKLPHNVVGLIGVANSSDGDLRPGLPLQMIEVHDPVRLLILVEHYPEVVLKTIKTEAAVYEWFINGWVHLVAIHPDTNEFYYFSEGAFTTYKPLLKTVNTIADMKTFLEAAKEMETNYIGDATKENLPVQVIEQ
jgi:uncharacterized protein